MVFMTQAAKSKPAEYFTCLESKRYQIQDNRVVEVKSYETIRSFMINDEGLNFLWDKPKTSRWIYQSTSDKSLGVFANEPDQTFLVGNNMTDIIFNGNSGQLVILHLCDRKLGIRDE